MRVLPRCSQTKRVPISSRIALLLAATLWAVADGYAQAPRQQLGGVDGTVRYFGAVPKAALQDNAGGRREILEVEPGGRGLRYTVIYLAAPVSNFSDAQAERSGDRHDGLLIVDQRDLRFVPHVVAVRSSEHVAFTNGDPENHNVRAEAENPRNRFNILTTTGTDYEKQFQPEPDGQPIRLSCDIHPWMTAWIFVFDHPYFDLSDVEGRFRLESVPEGTYRIVIRQPDGGLHAQGQVHVEAGRSTRVDVEFGPQNLQGLQIVDIDSQAASTEKHGIAGK